MQVNAKRQPGSPTTHLELERQRRRGAERRQAGQAQAGGGGTRHRGSRRGGCSGRGGRRLLHRLLLTGHCWAGGHGRLLSGGSSRRRAGGRSSLLCCLRLSSRLGGGLCRGGNCCLLRGRRRITRGQGRLRGAAGLRGAPGSGCGGTCGQSLQRVGCAHMQCSTARSRPYPVPPACCSLVMSNRTTGATPPSVSAGAPAAAAARRRVVRVVAGVLLGSAASAAAEHQVEENGGEQGEDGGWPGAGRGTGNGQLAAAVCGWRPAARSRLTAVRQPSVHGPGAPHSRVWPVAASVLARERVIRSVVGCIATQTARGPALEGWRRLGAAAGRCRARVNEARCADMLEFEAGRPPRCAAAAPQTCLVRACRSPPLFSTGPDRAAVYSRHLQSSQKGPLRPGPLKLARWSAAAMQQALVRIPLGMCTPCRCLASLHRRCRCRRRQQACRLPLPPTAAPPPAAPSAGGLTASVDMSLRLVEVHRSTDGGWELVRGGLKPACAAAAAAATPATGALPVPPADPGQPPRFRPLAALFAECLQQDSQMNAAFAGGGRPLWAVLHYAVPAVPCMYTLRPSAHQPHHSPRQRLAPSHCSGACRH